MGFLDRFRRRSTATSGTPPEPDPETPRPSIEDQRDDAGALAAGQLGPGLCSREDAVSWLADVIEDDPESYPDLSARDAVEILAATWARLAAVQASWSDEGDYTRLRAAFDELDASGVVARMNFACCQTCGHSEIGDQSTGASRGYTFFHQQDAERLGPDGGDLYLAFGAFGPDQALAGSEERVAAEVVDTLTRHGLGVEWDGTNQQRIRLPDLRWRKRLPVG